MVNVRTSGVVITFRKALRPEPDVDVKTPVAEQVAGEVTGEVALGQGYPLIGRGTQTEV